MANVNWVKNGCSPAIAKYYLYFNTAFQKITFTFHFGCLLPSRSFHTVQPLWPGWLRLQQWLSRRGGKRILLSKTSWHFWRREGASLAFKYVKCGLTHDWKCLLCLSIYTDHTCSTVHVLYVWVRDDGWVMTDGRKVSQCPTFFFIHLKNKQSKSPSPSFNFNRRAILCRRISQGV